MEIRLVDQDLLPAYAVLFCLRQQRLNQLKPFVIDVSVAVTQRVGRQRVILAIALV